MSWFLLPVEDPGCGTTRHGSSQFIGLDGDGGVVKPGPGEVPLSGAPCSDGPAVHRRPQVRVNPEGERGRKLVT